MVDAVPWTRLVAPDGFHGDLEIEASTTTTAWEDIEQPYVTWRVPAFALESLTRALEALDQVGAVMHDTSGEGPSGWEDVTASLRAAADYLVEAGLMHRRDGHLFTTDVGSAP